MLKRRLNSQGTVDSQTVSAVQFDTVAAGQAQFESAPKLTILGALDAAVSVGQGAIVKVFNVGVATHYVAIGAAAMAAPTDCTDGIAVPVNTYVTINTATDGTYIRSDSADVFGYKVERDSVLLDIADTNS
jgi:hypothetical protein